MTIEENFKVLREIQIGQPKSLVAEKYGKSQKYKSLHGFYQNNKEKIMTTFSSGVINLKRENMKLGKYYDLGKAVFKWLMATGIK